MIRLHRWGRFFCLAFIVVLAIGCGDDDDDDAGANDDSELDDDDDDDGAPTAGYDEPCPEGPEFAFGLTALPLVVPYPNDLYRLPDPSSPTGYRVQIDGQTTRPMGRLGGHGFFRYLVKAVNTLNGFSTLADLQLPVGEAPDESSLENGVLVFAADPTRPHDGQSVPVEVRMLEGYAHLRPQYALRQSTRYVLAATRSLRPAAGGCYRASPSMRRVWEAWKADDADDPVVGAYVDVLDALVKQGISPGDVLSVAAFTTQTNTDGLNDARRQLDQLAQADPPTFVDFKPVDAGAPHVQSFASATLLAPMFQNDDGYWERQGEDRFAPGIGEDLGVFFSLPKSDAGPNGQPFPLIVYGHPLTEKKEGIAYFGLGEFFAQHGFAMAAIDSVCHGSRTPFPHDRITATLCYFDFLDPRRFRDNIRQSVANTLWLVRALKSLDGLDMIPEGGDGEPDFDTDHIYYLGMSLNSIQGGTLATLEPSIPAWVMNVAGGKWTGIALEGPFMGWLVDIARILDAASPDLKAQELIWLAGGLYQQVLDASDPANFLPHLAEDPLPGLENHQPVILQQGAESDFIIGGQSGAYYCRAGGWPQLGPYVWDVGFVEHASCPHAGSGFYQYDSFNHVGLLMGNDLGDAMRAQAAHFLRTHYDTGTAWIIDPFESD